MKGADNGLEIMVLKWTFGAIFLGMTLVFAGKIGALLFAVAKMKLITLKAWLLSGDLLHELAQALKDAIFGGGK
jgi:hypothetical protein